MSFLERLLGLLIQPYGTYLLYSLCMYVRMCVFVLFVCATISSFIVKGSDYKMKVKPCFKHDSLIYIYFEVYGYEIELNSNRRSGLPKFCRNWLQEGSQPSIAQKYCYK